VDRDSYNMKNKAIAEETEYSVQEKLNFLGMHCISVADNDVLPYDLVADKVPIEVKSCHIVKRNGSKHKKSLGYFKFRKSPYEALLQSDAYYCFVVLHNGERMIAGFKKSSELGSYRSQRSVYDVLHGKLLTKNEFLEMVKHKQ